MRALECKATKEQVLVSLRQQEKYYLAFGNEHAATTAQNLALLLADGPPQLSRIDIDEMTAQYLKRFSTSDERKWHHGVMAGVILINAIAQYALM